LEKNEFLNREFERFKRVFWKGFRRERSEKKQEISLKL